VAVSHDRAIILFFVRTEQDRRDDEEHESRESGIENKPDGSALSNQQLSAKIESINGGTYDGEQPDLACSSIPEEFNISFDFLLVDLGSNLHLLL